MVIIDNQKMQRHRRRKNATRRRFGQIISASVVNASSRPRRQHLDLEIERDYVPTVMLVDAEVF